MPTSFESENSQHFWLLLNLSDLKKARPVKLKASLLSRVVCRYCSELVPHGKNEIKKYHHQRL